MGRLSSILCLGLDPDLLQTRELLLKTIGAEVKCTTNVTEALGDASAGHFDIIILCHSLKPSVAVAIFEATRQQEHPPSILQVTRFFGIEEERAHILWDCSVEAHPASLTHRVREILLKRAQNKVRNRGTEEQRG